MSFSNPSIRSFFQSEVPLLQPKRPSAAKSGDAFTSSEVEDARHPDSPNWKPRIEYLATKIGHLSTGPKSVKITGRVVNLVLLPTSSKRPQAAKGCLKMVVKDNTGAVTVKLWFAKVDYGVKLGQLVTVYTPHISNADFFSLNTRYVRLMASIFPERDNSCYFANEEGEHTDSLCRTPMWYEEHKPLDGLITLENFVDGGYDIEDVKILVCVKGVGAHKKFTLKSGALAEKVDVLVFDHTAEATLVLWSALSASAAPWNPSFTILLLSRPGFKRSPNPTLIITQNTYVDVDPLIPDASWLRGFAQKLTKREHVNPSFPMEAFDVEAALSAQERVLFTLADLDDVVRSNHSEPMTGYLSVLIFNLNLTSLVQKGRLFSTECGAMCVSCGRPLYSNTTNNMAATGAPDLASTTRTALRTCPHCSSLPSSPPLRLNPRIIGTLMDETGSIESGAVIWSDEAWRQLLQEHTAEDLAKARAEELRRVEEVMMWKRISILFGWSSNVGRLVGLRVWGH